MGPKTTTKKTSKTIEETYKKVGQVDHILLRPDTYIGDVKLQKELMWVYSETLDKIVEKEINYVPGLYKIFDEVLVNAGDRVQEDSTCDTIKVNIDKKLTQLVYGIMDLEFLLKSIKNIIFMYHHLFLVNF